VILDTNLLANFFTSTETKKTSWDKPADFDAPSSVRKMVGFVEASANNHTAAFVRSTSMEGIQDSRGQGILLQCCDQEDGMGSASRI